MMTCHRRASDHTRPLYISVSCSGRRVPSVLLDNGSALNYSEGSHGYIGDRVADRAGAIPSSLHQKVKFIHDGQVVVVQSVGDMFIAAEPVLEISHTDDDIFLTGFTFDEVQTVEIEDFCQDFVAMSFDQHGSTVVLDIMRSISYLPGMGVGSTPDEHGTFAEVGDIVDGAAPHDEYIDEMLALSLSQIEETIQPGLASSFDLFGVSAIELTEEIPTAPALESAEDLIAFDDLIGSHVGIVEGASNSVDPPLSFDVLSGDTEIVDFGTTDQPRELRIGSDLSTDERYSLIQLLRSYLDVFAWSYEDMPGLDPSIIPASRDPEAAQCRILISGRVPGVAGQCRPCSQEGGKMRVCVDFRDLNKAILMAPEDMEKTSFITEWGTYCYKVMPFGLKNTGARYQRAATTLFHDMMHRDVEVYVDDMIVKSRDRSDHLAALERFFERIRQFRLRLNPKKCTFGVTSGKLLGYMRERSEASWGRLQYINRFIARLTDICEPIFQLLRKSQPTAWDDQCQRAFERIREYLLSPPVLAPSTLGRPLLLYLSISDVALGCMLAQLYDSGKDRAIYYLSKRMLDYEMRYVMIERYCLTLVWAIRRLRHYMTEYSVHLISRLDPLRYLFDRPALKSIRGSIIADHLASLPVSDAKAIDDDFPDEDVAAVTSLSGWRMYFDGAANHSGYGIGALLISLHGDHIPRSVRLAFSDRHPATNNIIQGEWKTRDVKLRPYHAYLELLVGRFDDLRYTHLPRAQNQFADALATLPSMIDIPVDATVRPLLIESRSTPAYCCLIDDVEPDDGLPWYHDIYHFLRLGVYPEAARPRIGEH
ncbi:Retrovirus-related Pol polyprotein from transposon 17.6 [Vitis vinifera]|uniref:Retrovirus-related Pol polyprotein from transposon 17.6 n=1 Tax=Vitis vinifera TaxID=29760 RepID=A0A438BU06_VITVI|nr:Retrovirus-related Pol polyprotein from transposon 17.6 [Vitis vinifera]